MSSAIRIDEQREGELLQWTINQCGGAPSSSDSSSSYSHIDFEEGWRMIDEFGLRFIRTILSEFLVNSNATPTGSTHKTDAIANDISKPFGYKGYVSLYTISYKIAQSNISAADAALELYNRYSFHAFFNLNTNRNEDYGPNNFHSITEFTAFTLTISRPSK